jgi:hypothetical protein
MNLIKEAHTSKVARHFSVGKTIANLQRHAYYPRMHKYVARYIRGCIFCCTNKPSNIKQGLYHPLPIPTRPWERSSMDFVGGLPTTKKRHGYLFLVVDRFNNMHILMPCKNTIKEKEEVNMFFE